MQTRRVNGASSRAPKKQQFRSLDDRFLTVLKEKTKRWPSREALRMNILAAVQVSELVRTMLGPKGMDKILDHGSTVTFSSDSNTLLSEAGVTNPIGKMLVELAKVQHDQIGDGTTSTIVLTGMLLAKAEKLIDVGLHPTTIISGYGIARAKVLEALLQLASAIDPSNRVVLRDVARTSMRYPLPRYEDQVVEAVLQVKTNDASYFDRDMIKIQAQKGRTVGETELVKGVVLKNDRLSRATPEKVFDAKIALLDFPISPKPLRTDIKVEIKSVESYANLHRQEDSIMESLVEGIKASGATAVFNQKGFHKEAWRHFASRKIFVAKRVTSKDMELLSKATGGIMTSTVDDLNSDKLGFAKVVEERKFDSEKVIVVEGCKNPKAATLFVRAATDQSLEKLQKDFGRSIGAVSATVEDPRILPGGGATEIELSRRLRQYSSGMHSRERLAVDAFADALEEILFSLMRNSGLKSRDLFLKMRNLHDEGQETLGFDSYSNTLVDTKQKGILDSYRVRSHMIKLAADAAISILRIDDVIVASGMTEKEAQEKGYEKATH